MGLVPARELLIEGSRWWRNSSATGLRMLAPWEVQPIGDCWAVWLLAGEAAEAINKTAPSEALGDDKAQEDGKNPTILFYIGLDVF